MSDASTKPRRLPKKHRVAGLLLAGAVVIFCAAVGYRTMESQYEDYKFKQNDMRGAIIMVQTSEWPGEEGLQTLHILNEIAPGGKWSASRTKALNRRLYYVRYKADGKSWQWLVSMDDWTVERMD